MKILITGSNGQLGRQLITECKKRSIEYVGYDVPELDITNIKLVQSVVEKESPDIIINCAALTDVDGCEGNAELAFAVNAYGPKNLAEISKNKDILLVHLSTDYVFDGQGVFENGHKRPYVESDCTNPKTVYGKSKKAGEDFVVDNTSKYFIIRSAWLYGDGNNFVKTMLRLAENHPQITVVSDQVGSPTSTVDLARAIIELIQTDAYGIYHGTCEGQCSWYDFAIAIFEKSGVKIDVKPVSSEEYASPTPRPHYSVLRNKGLEDLKINVFRPWEEALSEYLKWLKEN